MNTNYEQFLSLGSDLKGGEEKVEDVRVGLLGFKRGVEDVRTKVKERKIEVERLLGEKKAVSRDVAVGRKLLEIDSRLEELEERLMVASLARPVNGNEEDAWSESEDDDEDEGELALDVGIGGSSTRKLHGLVIDCRHVEHLATRIGTSHPFIVAQQSRMQRVRNTILLDLSTALKQAASMGEPGSARLMKILSIYRDFEANAEAVKILKDLKS